MSAVETSSLQPAASWRDYYELGKPRVVMLIMFTAIAGMFLAAPGLPPLNALIFGTLGIALAASSAAAINHVLDRRFDEQMARTRNRPLPTGHVTERQALGYALVLAVVSMVLLWGCVNALTAVLTFCSLIGYAVIYTVWLKHATPQNIVIGGAAGAAPPVLGWTAVTGSVDPHSLLLFLIIFTWTPPHFWALAIARRDEYAKAGIPMLPVAYSSDFTRLHILLYTILLVIVTLLPYLTGMSGLIYLAAALILGALFLFRALQLKVRQDARLPMQTFGYSITYLALLFAALLIDHYVTIRLT
ncbi:protoheme IX farnesyltransferase [Steroidobacter agaridevorans]|uniref:Protoheme IX farnesyltransferase n=1 Tax=Steroidobacter agaridevorans TaxID=2695856 RepID=A0A829Y5L0_9GAMM|nr:heme o synthase [Steroidobacter agaridevorans]GFE78373.1 protoheme IX farnesyltransferase [Steroidobacter agaridevorans]GFE89695.1 protoheme IX farnesyltransferase [Steroidobacter agaridevorans]